MTRGSSMSTRMLAPLLAWLILTLTATFPALAQAPAPAPTPVAAPPVSGLPELSVRDNVTRTVLKNGLTVLVVEDHATDIVGMEMLFRVGQVNEDDSTAGITNLIQNILVRRISKDASPDDPHAVESKGSILNANASPDYAEISLLTDDRNFKGFLGTIAGAVARRSFSDDEIIEERRKMVDYLEGDQRVFRAIYEIFLQQFYRYHPYRQPQEGHAGSVRQLNKSRLEAYYRRFWAPNRTVVCVVGDVDRREVVRILEDKMGTLPQEDDRKLEVSWEPKHDEKELYLSSGSNLAWIFLGFPAPSLKDPNYMPMRVLHGILGEGLSSRMWVELRERRGLAYELGSIYPSLEGPSHMIEYIVTTPGQLRESQSRMFKEISRIKKDLVLPTELEAAKRKLIGQYLLERETNKGRALHLGLAELLAGGYQVDLQMVDLVRRVTAEDVRRVAQAYLNDNYTLVVARPRGTFFY